MALKSLSVDEMVQVSAPWTSPTSEAYKALTSIPMLAGLLPQLGAAHEAIFAVQPRNDPRRTEIIELSQTIDVVHDTLVRGIHSVLTGASLLSDEGQVFISLRDTLMPEGLGETIRKTYRGQAGYASLLKSRLTPALKTQLGGVRINELTLLNYVERWIEAGERLGQLADEATQLEDQQSPSFAAQVNTARLGWIQTVNALLTVADIAPLSDEQRSTIFRSLRDAEATAEQRSARRRSGEIVEELEQAIETAAPAAPPPAS